MPKLVNKESGIQVTLRFSKEDHGFLKATSIQRGVKPSDVIRSAVEEFRLALLIETHIKDSIVRNIDRFKNEDEFRAGYPNDVGGRVIPGASPDALRQFIADRFFLVRDGIRRFAEDSPDANEETKEIVKDMMIGIHVLGSEFYGSPSLLQPSLFDAPAIPAPAPKARNTGKRAAKTSDVTVAA